MYLIGPADLSSDMTSAYVLYFPAAAAATPPPPICRVDFQVYLVLISDCNSLVYSLLSEGPVTCDLGLSSVYLGLAESSFGLILPIFPTIIF